MCLIGFNYEKENKNERFRKDGIDETSLERDFRG